MKVKIKAKLEISDHDGYCSGGECEYSFSIKEYIIDVPNDEYNEYDGNYINWVYYLPKPNIDTWGSGYCDLSNECNVNGLDKHDYRYTILEVTIMSQ